MKLPRVLRGRWSTFREMEELREYNTFRVILLFRGPVFRKLPSFNHFHSAKVRVIKLKQQGFHYTNGILKHIRDLRC